MRALFRLHDTVRRHPGVQEWLDKQQGAPGELARHWFHYIRRCGDDVEEVLHDDQPTACVAGAAFAYVDAFTAHASVGFFQGAALPDPKSLLQGTGKYMRHIKLRPGEEYDSEALMTLVQAAYIDVRKRLAGECASQNALPGEGG